MDDYNRFLEKILLITLIYFFYFFNIPYSITRLSALFPWEELGVGDGNGYRAKGTLIFCIHYYSENWKHWLWSCLVIFGFYEVIMKGNIFDSYYENKHWNPNHEKIVLLTDFPIDSIYNDSPFYLDHFTFS